jgi:two-component system LytT family response regulator
MTLKTILLDDETHCVELLQHILGQHCPDVEVVGGFTRPEEARAAILRNAPDLLILDIEMPGLNGFELLQSLQPLDFAVVFCTAYDHFAIQALRVAAVDYLLKPIDEEELVKAVARVKSHVRQSHVPPGLEALLAQHPPRESTPGATLALPTTEGLDFVLLDDILYCRSDSNYCHVMMRDGRRILLSKTLKEIEAKLPKDRFFRQHNSYLVNLREIRRYLRADGGSLMMSNGEHLPVARNRKDELLSRF